MNRKDALGKRSADGWYERAAIIPGRSNTRSKAPGRMYPVGAGPHYVMDAWDQTLRCTDGKRRLDMQCALGAVSIGYRPYAKEGRGRDRQPLGVCSLPHVVEIQAAEEVLEHVAPWASQARFVRTGSEATLGALMVAQLATRRSKFARLSGSYHGWYPTWQPDYWLARYFKVGELPSVSSLSECAAVIIEPPRWEEFTYWWIADVIKAAHEAGALVIFDEMIYGGRWALGGLAEFASTELAGLIINGDRGELPYGNEVTPDLACYGKALGNGAPVAMVVGGDALAEHGQAISGTYSGDVAALTALRDTLAAYQERDVIDWMWRRGTQLQRGLRAECELSSIDVEVEGAPVHQRLKFSETRERTPESWAQLFAAEMGKRAIVWAGHSTNIMRAHSEADIETAVDAAGASLRALSEKEDG